MRRALGIAGVLAAVYATRAWAHVPEVTAGVWEAIGRLHPFLVHFPVALVATAAVAEALGVIRREERFGESARFLVGAAAWMSVLAMATGFLRADGLALTSDVERAFTIHRIAGIATPVLVFLAAGLAEGVRRSGQIWELYLYRIVLLLAAITALVAGRFGGELVFGPAYFPLW